MKNIFLPGNSSRNRKWIDRLAQEFDTPKEVIHYNHWDRREGSINFKYELEKLSKLKTEKSVIVAKSLGCILTLKAIKQNIFIPQKCYFIGFPLYYVQQNNVNLKELLSTDISITFIQKPEDYQASFKHLKDVMSEIRNKRFNFIEYHRNDEPDDNHHYNNTAYLKEIITSV